MLHCGPYRRQNRTQHARAIPKSAPDVSRDDFADDATLEEQAITAQFYRQDAVTGPNLTRLGLTWPNRARHCSDGRKNMPDSPGG